jgi:RimJ/RimL family protein N-acetyltransferase
MTDTRAAEIPAGSVYLRRFTLDDTATIFRLSQEEGMRTWLPDQVYADEAEARDVLSYLASQYDSPDAPQKLPYVLAVCLSGSEELIGHVGFSPCSYGVEVGYAIAQACQNRGHAKRAVGAATAWAIAAFGLPAVYAVVAEDNASSCKVLEACGFRLQDSLVRKLHGIERMCRVYQYTAAEPPVA